MTRFFAISAFPVGTIADKVTCLVAFFADDFVHVHRFLHRWHKISIAVKENHEPKRLIGGIGQGREWE